MDIGNILNEVVKTSKLFHADTQKELAAEGTKVDQNLALLVAALTILKEDPQHNNANGFHARAVGELARGLPEERKQMAIEFAKECESIVNVAAGLEGASRLGVKRSRRLREDKEPGFMGPP